MKDYLTLIDKRIHDLQEKIDLLQQEMQNRIDLAIEEYLFRKACKVSGIEMPAYNGARLKADIRAGNFPEKIQVLQEQIKALQTLRQRLEEPAVKAEIDAEVEELIASVFPDERTG